MSDDARLAQAGDVDHAALRPGRQVGRYEIISILGQGGFGITYRARDSELERHVAMKEYLPSALAVRQDGVTVVPRSTKMAEDFIWGRDRFVAEGRTLASLDHARSIVRVFDFLQANGTAYIVMELVKGETLEALIKQRGRFAGDAVERILWPLLDGLEQVHNAGFLHRDIKPANILLDAEGRPTLIDFGASRAAMAGRTTAMTAIFTPGYAAAEQMTSGKQGPWTDIYGLSATLYHAIVGRPPANAFERVLGDACEPIVVAAGTGFPSGILAGIDAGLAVAASDRPQSIAEWRAILTGASVPYRTSPGPTQAPADTAATIVVRAPTIQPPPSSPSAAAPLPTAIAKRRTVLYSGISAAVLLSFGVGGYLVYSGWDRTAMPALQAMKVEDLERALNERRAAEAAAAEKMRLEDDARRKADAEATSKQAADADLQRAEEARRNAEAELAKLKADIDTRRQEAQNEARRLEAEAAQRRAEAEMAALRQTEEDARRRAAAEAEAKRQADDALAKAQAERQKADEEAKRKAEAEAKEQAEATARQIAEAEAKSKADADGAARKVAEAAEAALRLSMGDRQRLQVALSSLGFDTRGSDGAFGPRSREMIGNWQKARNQPATGFLDGPQRQALLREAAPAVQKHDDEQRRKEEEDRKKAEEGAKASVAPATAPTVAPGVSNPAPAGPVGTTQGGGWTGGATCNVLTGTIGMQLAPGQMSGRWTGDNASEVKLTISGNQFSGTISSKSRNGNKSFTGSFSGPIVGGQISAQTVARADARTVEWPNELRCSIQLVAK